MCSSLPVDCFLQHTEWEHDQCCGVDMCPAHEPLKVRWLLYSWAFVNMLSLFNCTITLWFFRVFAEMCLKLRCRWNKGTGIAKRSAEMLARPFSPLTDRVRLAHKAIYHRMVDSIVGPVCDNQTRHLDLCSCGFRHQGHCLVSNFTVHGRRALRQSARHSGTGQNRKRSRLKDAVIRNEGK